MTCAHIRRASRPIFRALLDIYNHYVVNTHITFDLEPRTLAEGSEWLAQFHASGRYQCFVAEEDGRRSAGHARRGSRRTPPTTPPSRPASISRRAGGRGLGRALYDALFDALKGEDIHRAYGGITLPNDASVRLHVAMGFGKLAAYREVGRKFGRFWDVDVYERAMF